MPSARGPSCPRRGASASFTAWAMVMYAFLYLPILVMVIFAFDKPSAASLASHPGRDVCDIPPDQIGNITVWNGFTACWFSAGLHDPTYIPAILTSLQIAAVAAIIATALGLLRRAGAGPDEAADAGAVRRPRVPGLVVPEIVIAVASLIFFVQARNHIHGLPGTGQAHDPARPGRVQRRRWRC